MQPVGVMSLPLLSRLRKDPVGLRETALKCLRATAVIAVPLCSSWWPRVTSWSRCSGRWGKRRVPLQLLVLAGIGKAVGLFTGPVLFAVSRPRFRAVMLWVIAGVSVAVAVVVGDALSGASVETQVIGMSASPAVLFLVVLLQSSRDHPPVHGGVGRKFLRDVPGPTVRASQPSRSCSRWGSRGDRRTFPAAGAPRRWWRRPGDDRGSPSPPRPLWHAVMRVGSPAGSGPRSHLSPEAPRRGLPTVGKARPTLQADSALAPPERLRPARVLCYTT